MPKTESKRQLGGRGEDLACAELQRQGMQVLERNWRCRIGGPEMFSEDATVKRRKGLPGAAIRNVLGDPTPRNSSSICPEQSV
jgi:Uncharacterised protein family UPF0102